MAENQKHWGRWIESRSQFIGYKRQQDLADAIGCSRRQVAQWLNLPVPPLRMRKGFDDAMARALKTTRQVLFTDYAAVPPDASPEQQESSLYNFQWLDPRWEKLSMLDKLRYLIAIASKEDLEKIVDYAVVLTQFRLDVERIISDGSYLTSEKPFDPRVPPPPDRLVETVRLLRSRKKKDSQ